VKIREYVFIHIYLRIKFGRLTHKNTDKNDIFLYAYMQVLAGTQYCLFFPAVLCS